MFCALFGILWIAQPNLLVGQEKDSDYEIQGEYSGLLNVADGEHVSHHNR